MRRLVLALALVFAGFLPCDAALVQTHLTSFNVTTTPMTLSFTPTNGRILVAMGFNTTPNNFTIGAGWTQIDNNTTTTPRVMTAYKVASGETTSQSPWTTTSATGSCIIWEYSGQAAGAAAIDNHSIVNFASAASPQVMTLPSVTPSLAEAEALVGWTISPASTSANVTITGTGVTLVQDAYPRTTAPAGALYHQSNIGTSAYAPSISVASGATGNGGAAMVILAPAAASTGWTQSTADQMRLLGIIH